MYKIYLFMYIFSFKKFNFVFFIIFTFTNSNFIRFLLSWTTQTHYEEVTTLHNSNLKETTSNPLTTSPTLHPNTNFKHKDLFSAIFLYEAMISQSLCITTYFYNDTSLLVLLITNPSSKICLFTVFTYSRFSTIKSKLYYIWNGENQGDQCGCNLATLTSLAPNANIFLGASFSTKPWFLKFPLHSLLLGWIFSTSLFTPPTFPFPPIIDFSFKDLVIYCIFRMIKVFMSNININEATTTIIVWLTTIKSKLNLLLKWWKPWNMIFHCSCYTYTIFC